MRIRVKEEADSMVQFVDLKWGDTFRLPGKMMSEIFVKIQPLGSSKMGLCAEIGSGYLEEVYPNTMAIPVPGTFVED